MFAEFLTALPSRLCHASQKMCTTGKREQRTMGGWAGHNLGTSSQIRCPEPGLGAMIRFTPTLRFPDTAWDRVQRICRSSPFASLTRRRVFTQGEVSGNRKVQCGGWRMRTDTALRHTSCETGECTALIARADRERSGMSQVAT